MKQSFIVTLVCLLILISFITPVHGLPWPPDMDVIYIKFNYTSGYSYDALTIKKNYSTEVQVPEWYPSYSRNEPFAYIKSQSNRKIEAKFWVEGGGRETIKIKAIVSGQGVGNINTTAVAFNGSQYATTVMTCSGSVPGSVGIRSFSWNWYATQIDDYIFEDPLWIGDTGNHEYYTLLAAPQSPMAVPWTEVLDYACNWANGKMNASDAVDTIVQGLYNWGLNYDIDEGAPYFPEEAGGGNSNFYLTAFLQAKGTSSLCNCYDMGKAVKTFCNAIGCGTSYRYSSPFGYLNCIKPIGRDWTNNPFYPNLSSPYNVPIVGEDLAYPYRTYFGNHAFGSISDYIYDACLKADTDSNPDAPPHSNNGNGDWAIGWIWNDYKTNVVDNNPATSTGYPTSSYNSWSVY